MTDLVTLPPEAEATPVAYKGQTVITTERLAGFLGATPKMLSENYQNNRDRFMDDGHLYVVSGAELKQLKASPIWSGEFSPTTPKAYLWTERGCFRHAKILNTPEAWQAYEKLEETYFAVKAGKLLPAPVAAKKLSPRYRDWLACAKLIGLKGTQAIVAANRATTKETGVNVLEALGQLKLEEETATEPHYTVTVLAARMGIRSAQAMNLLLEKYGLQTVRHGEEPRWQPTDKGRPYAVLVTADPAHGRGKAHQAWEWKAEVIKIITRLIEQDAHLSPL